MLSVIQYFQFVFMACAVYLQELIIFTATFHIVCISHYKSIKSIDDNLYRQNPNNIANCLPVILLQISGYGVTATTVITESIKDDFKIVTSQTERRVVSNNCYHSRNMTPILL